MNINHKTCNILLDRCFELAKLSNCQKRQFGSVIVPTPILRSDWTAPIELLNEIMAQGVNHTYDWEKCDPCLRANIPSGTRMGVCRAVHSEQAAVLDYFSRKGKDLSGYTLLISGREGDERLYKKEPGFYCTLCSRMLAAVKIDGMVVLTFEEPVYLTMSEALASSFKVALGLEDAGTVTKEQLDGEGP